MRKENGVKTVVIAGAGLMGASMAQIFAKSGRRIKIYDISETSIEKGTDLIKINQEAMVSAGRNTRKEADEIIARIDFSTDINIFREADFVVECIIEKMSIKKKFWEEASKIAPPDIALCSNTSGMSITQIGTAVQNPERFAGMHWVNPPHLCPLVEVIKGSETSTETMDTVYAVAKSIGQSPVKVLKDVPGFILNRLQYALLREACNIVDNEIASVEDVDKVLTTGLGVRYAVLGPFQTVDLGGLDTFYNVGSYMFDELSNAAGVPKIIKEHYEKGEYGTKSGKGFYNYPGSEVTEAIKKRDEKLMKVADALFGE